MFRQKTIKNSVFVLVALLLCAVVVFAACNPSTVFKPVQYENGKQVDGNGGIAVRYGDYVYYVNGYQSSSSAKNNYSTDIRVGSIVRIKIADLESIIRINTEDSKSDVITKKISKTVAEKAEVVVPNFYYSGNTTDTSLNGIYIFNDRLYIITPNNELDASGNLLSSQLVLTSYNLGGGDVQRHYVFKSNAPQLKLSKVGDDVYATFVLDNTLSTLKLTNGLASSATEIEKEISSPKFTSEVDANGVSVADYVYYLNKDGSICQFKVGDETAKTIVVKEVEEGHEGHSHNDSYTIQSASGSRLYYTISNDTALYCATAEVPDKVALSTVPTSYYGFGNGVVYTASEAVEDATIYHIYTASGDGSDKRDVIDPTQVGESITFNKLVGNVLYYTTNSISYTLDLSNPEAKPVAYAYSLSTSATGWSVPDVLSFSWTNGEKTENVTYVFSLSSNTVTVVKFNPERNNNYIEGTKDTSSSTNLTLKVQED